MPKPFNEAKKDNTLKEKGIYIISTPSLQKKNFYKIGVSGSSLIRRVYSLREVLTPALMEPIIIYGVVVPKNAKKSGLPQNVRAKELNQIERAVHKIYQQKGLRDVFCDSRNYSEWVYEKKIDKLFDTIRDIIGDPDDTYKIHFKFVSL